MSLVPAAAPPPPSVYEVVTETVSEPVFRRAGRLWRIVFAASCVLVLVMIVSVGGLFIAGIGVWGLNTTVVWGFDITNYIWWIGIGNAGTLISALLLLTRQHWRASINRFAEAMTLFAAAIAGLFPILHLGRPQYFYWLAPYPNVMGLWPQWRSPLVWDFFAIGSYIVFSIVFWYVGLIPDLATMRDRARTRRGQVLYGFFALGWYGSSKQWRRLESLTWAMAAMAVPLVVSVHSVVGLDFAAGLEPGWAESIFPPYFVVGAMFSGFAMVATLAAAIRWGLNLQTLITERHFDVMAKILLFGAIAMGLSYATEWAMAWYGGARPEISVVTFAFTGAYAHWYWLMLFCNVLAPQLFWLPRFRRSLWSVFIIAVLINIGMWLERILIIVNTLSHDFLPSQWRLYAPTVWEWGLMFGSFGFYCFLFLILVRLIPAVSMHETRRHVYEEERP